jgi:energy-coupling factor transporter ATP-binding protein EcfA2
VTSELPGFGKTELIRKHAHDQQLELRTLLITGPVTREDLVQKIAAAKLHSGCALHINVLDVTQSRAANLNIMLFELVCLGMVTSNVAAAVPMVSRTCNTIYLELANTVGYKLQTRLRLCDYFGRSHLAWERLRLLVPPSVMSDMQIVCNYLNQLKQTNNEGKSTLDGQILVFKEGNHTFPPNGDDGSNPFALAESLESSKCYALLDEFFFTPVKECTEVVQLPNFTIMNIFCKLLAEQLRRFTISAFYMMENVTAGGGGATTRSDLVKGFVFVALKFALRSVPSTAQHHGVIDEVEALAARVGKLVNFEDADYLLLMLTSGGILTPFYRDMGEVFEQRAGALASYVKAQPPFALPQYTQQPTDKSTLDYQRRMLFELIKFVQPSLDSESDKWLTFSNRMLDNYALAGDNLLKMLLIYSRVQVGLPVVIMGETGCGKTSLVKFLAAAANMPDDNFRVMNFHAGLSCNDITSFIESCEERARECAADAEQKKMPPMQVWAFLDEVNTSHHIGLAADLVSHHQLLGRPVHPGVVFICACNPAKLRDESKVERVGLQFKLQTEDPMRKLVYRVYPLPESVLDVVWDFGSLKPADEARFIDTMLHDKNLVNRLSAMNANEWTLVARLVVESQKFVREAEEDFSVSLRDVQRFKKLLPWFHETIEARKTQEESKQDIRGRVAGWFKSFKEIKSTSAALVLALSHCYYSRLRTSKLREQYRTRICATWREMDLNGPTESVFFESTLPPPTQHVTASEVCMARQSSTLRRWTTCAGWISATALP